MAMMLRLEIEADGFLYNMVRNIVGSLVDVGRGKRPPSWIEDVLESRQRGKGGATAPAHGLCLTCVQYDA
jgi:tRNA pseudouridine38-40 synthase